MPKTPIDPSDIRKGDLIRWEMAPNTMVSSRALEYVASYDGHSRQSNGSYYLLNRSKLPVELPTAPTLGWVDGEEGKMLARWVRGAGGSLITDPMREGLEVFHVKGFTYATAVPTRALDWLRSAIDRHAEDAGYDFSNDGLEIVETFLTVINEANA